MMKFCLEKSNKREPTSPSLLLPLKRPPNHTFSNPIEKRKTPMYAKQKTERYRSKSKKKATLGAPIYTRDNKRKISRVVVRNQSIDSHIVKNPKRRLKCSRKIFLLVSSPPSSCPALTIVRDS
jgi:hypothetical protein